MEITVIRSNRKTVEKVFPDYKDAVRWLNENGSQIMQRLI